MKKTPEDFGITKYTWNNGLLDCHQHVSIAHRELKEIPFNFGVIHGHFRCSYNYLTSLKGCPIEVMGDFDCRENQLTSMEGCPQIVKAINCSCNKLITLKGCPEQVSGNFLCSGNELESLAGSPKTVSGSFDCSSNKLTSLVGGPENVYYNFDCCYNKLTSLSGSPKIIQGDFLCGKNELSSLTGGPTIVRLDFQCAFNKITSLVGGPVYAQRYDCSHNEISSLMGIGNDFKSLSINFSHNKIESFGYFPMTNPDTEVDASYNQISCIKGLLSSVIFNFNIDHNLTELTIDDQTFLVKKHKYYFRSVKVVDNPDRETTIINLEKKKLIQDLVFGRKKKNNLKEVIIFFKKCFWP